MRRSWTWLAGSVSVAGMVCLGGWMAVPSQPRSDPPAEPAIDPALLQAAGLIGADAGPETNHLLWPSVKPPEPTHRDLAYGPHARHRLDLWLPAATVRTKAVDGSERVEPATGVPLVIFFHQGGFVFMDKVVAPGYLVTELLSRGVAVASANYRFAEHATLPGPMEDGARAVQYLRSRAVELGLDPERVAAAGNSAGAGIAMWVAFHEDLADAHSEDPVERESSRLSGVIALEAQPTYDPREFVPLFGVELSRDIFWSFGGLFDIGPRAILSFDREGWPAEAIEQFERASPLSHYSADDPPVMLSYGTWLTPIGKLNRVFSAIHDPRLGELLVTRASELGGDVTIEVLGRARKSTGTSSSKGYIDRVCEWLGVAGRPEAGR